MRDTTPIPAPRRGLSGSCGPHPASYGNRSSFARPPNGYGMNRNGNFYQGPNPNPGCFNCGDPTHRARNCPVSSAERRRPEQQSTSPPRPPAQQQPDVRPVKDHSDKQVKSCIWVNKYRQHKLSALIDTGSDVSIAGKDIARNLRWTIHAHHTKGVSVANNETMLISRVARVLLQIGKRKLEAEILISPDFEGLILGYDWISQQGIFDWDTPNDRVRIGAGGWIPTHDDEPLVRVRRVIATEDITIPAHGQVAAAAHMLHNAWSCLTLQTQYSVMESQRLDYGTRL